MAQQRVVPVAGVPDEGREPFVGQVDAELARDELPHAPLHALAVDEKPVHVADDGGGAGEVRTVEMRCSSPSRYRQSSRTE